MDRSLPSRLNQRHPLLAAHRPCKLRETAIEGSHPTLVPLCELNEVGIVHLAMAYQCDAGKALSSDRRRKHMGLAVLGA